MTKPDAVKAKLIEDNNRVFLLMIGYGKANLFRYLNKEFVKLLKVKPHQCELCYYYHPTGCQIDHYMPFYGGLVDICETYKEVDKEDL